MEERKDYLSWDEYFMALAQICALRSKDPNTRVGACLVDENNKVISLGYNGMPIGCEDKKMPWGKDSSIYLETKYPFVCHAELNAIINSKGKIFKEAVIYTTLFPCNECAKAIIQSEIKKVIYKENKYEDEDSFKAAKHMFDLVGIKYEKYVVKRKMITLNLLLYLYLI